MEKDYLNGTMVTLMMVNGKIIKEMVKGFQSKIIKINIMENGLMIKDMEKA